MLSSHRARVWGFHLTSWLLAFSGSREEAYDNLPFLSITMQTVARERPDVAFAMALAGNLSLDRAVDILKKDGWRVLPESGSLGKRRRYLTKENSVLLLAHGLFGDLLEGSRICLGLAGTANEQAAGLGRPVVAFPGPGAQFTSKFLAAQKRLLGDALVAAAGPEAAGQAILNILSDPKGMPLWPPPDESGWVNLGCPSHG